MSAPRAVSKAATCAADSPLASIGTRSPLPGTGAIIAMSVTGTPWAAPILASSALVPGAAVFRSAHKAPGPMAGSAARSALTASLALLTLSTRSAPLAASASPPAPVTPGGAGTAGSKPRTAAPAATRSRAISEPASPNPRTAMTPLTTRP
jgi:hypothetical protein